MKVLSVVGARPQFVKAAAFSRAVASWNRRGGSPPVDERIVHTGQHYDEGLSAVFFRELGIPRPHHVLDAGSGPHGAQIGRMLAQLEPVLASESPAWVVVFGDTNSTLAGALCAARLRIPVAHVEAGLRCGDRTMPEEQNRIVADHLSSLLCCPTREAVANLGREGRTHHRAGPPDPGAPRVCLTGDLMVDSLRFHLPEARGREGLLRSLGLLTTGRRPPPFALATVHRAENTERGERLHAILAGLSRVAAALTVIVPLHPRTRAALERDPALREAARGLTLIEPLGYLDMLGLLARCAFVCTDSGGLQKEAFLLDRPCVTLRERTEWVETVAAGWNVLAGAAPERIVAAAERAAAFASRASGASGAPFSPGRRKPRPYGDGRAAERIVRLIARHSPAPRCAAPVP